jgi:hypothetical protein
MKCAYCVKVGASEILEIRAKVEMQALIKSRKTLMRTSFWRGSQGI